MGSKSQKKVRVPPPTAPAAVPGMLSQSVMGARTNAYRKAQGGRGDTIIANNLGGGGSSLGGETSLGTTSTSSASTSPVASGQTDFMTSLQGMGKKRVGLLPADFLYKALKIKYG